MIVFNLQAGIVMLIILVYLTAVDGFDILHTSLSLWFVSASVSTLIGEYQICLEKYGRKAAQSFLRKILRRTAIGLGLLAWWAWLKWLKWF